MEWSTDLVLDFLSHYENEPIIWNPSVANHKDRNEVFEAWKRIQDKMGNTFSITDLKKKKDSLMASYRTCLKKLKDTSKSGAGACEVIKPNWFAFEIMDRFLKYKSVPIEILNSEVTLTENHQGQSQNSDLEHDLTLEKEEPVQENEAFIPPTTCSSSMKPPVHKRPRTADEVEIKMKMNSALSVLQLLQAKKEKNVCDIYGKLVAAKLKAMDENTRDVCMHRIDNILFEMRMVEAPAQPDHSYHRRNIHHSTPSSSAMSSPSPNKLLTLYSVGESNGFEDVCDDNVCDDNVCDDN